MSDLFNSVPDEVIGIICLYLDFISIYKNITYLNKTWGNIITPLNNNSLSNNKKIKILYTHILNLSDNGIKFETTLLLNNKKINYWYNIRDNSDLRYVYDIRINSRLMLSEIISIWPSNIIKLNLTKVELLTPNFSSVFNNLPNTLKELTLHDIIWNYNEIPKLPSYLISLTVQGVSFEFFKALKLPNTLLSFVIRSTKGYLPNFVILPPNLTELVSTVMFNNLPSSLKTLSFLNCKECEFLPALPICIESLCCENLGLKDLSNMPNSLVRLKCGFNEVDDLLNLPTQLKYFDCNQCRIKNFMFNSFPSNLIVIVCSYNSLTTLPSLPNTLESLDCNYNFIIEIPILPSRLKVLNCTHNKLLDLPILPESLEVLNCKNNKIKELKNVPQSLKRIGFPNLINPEYLSTSVQCLEFVCDRRSYTFYPDHIEHIKTFSKYVAKLKSTSIDDQTQALQWMSLFFAYENFIPKFSNEVVKIIYYNGRLYEVLDQLVLFSKSNNNLILKNESENIFKIIKRRYYEIGDLSEQMPMLIEKLKSSSMK